jgi:hypothetical protein
LLWTPAPVLFLGCGVGNTAAGRNPCSFTNWWWLFSTYISLFTSILTSQTFVSGEGNEDHPLLPTVMSLTSTVSSPNLVEARGIFLEICVKATNCIRPSEYGIFSTLQLPSWASPQIVSVSYRKRRTHSPHENWEQCEEERHIPT